MHQMFRPGRRDGTTYRRSLVSHDREPGILGVTNKLRRIVLLDVQSESLLQGAFELVGMLVWMADVTIKPLNDGVLA